MSDLSKAIFHDETKAREWLEGELWPNGPVCPHCGVVNEEVRGLIRYTNSGLPVSIKVDDITELPSPADLPSYKEMRGILGDQSDARRPPNRPFQ